MNDDLRKYVEAINKIAQARLERIEETKKNALNGTQFRERLEKIKEKSDVKFFNIINQIYQDGFEDGQNIGD